MPLEPIAVTAKCVGFNDLRARLQIFMVDASYKIWLGQIQFVVAAIDENALRVQPRAHSAVAKKGGRLQAGDQISGHDIENTGGASDLHSGQSGQIVFQTLCYNPLFASNSLSFNSLRS